MAQAPNRQRPGIKFDGSGSGPLVLFKLRVGVCLTWLGLHETVYEISVYEIHLNLT